MAQRREELTVEPSEDGLRLDRFLAARLPDLSRAFIQKLAREGLIRVDGVSARPSRLVKGGQVIGLSVPEPSPVDLAPEPIPIDVIHEDDDLLVLDKPAGMVVHPGAGVRSGTLVHALLARGSRWSSIGGELRPGIVHRLDRGTSGVLVVARTDRAHRLLSAQFKERTVEKSYFALVWGETREDRFQVTAPLGRDTKLRRRISPRTGKPREAFTHFRLVERLPNFTALEAIPRTGRTHQIRAHLKAAGHPIVGDREYGGDRWRNLPSGELRDRIHRMDRLALHARRIAFTHPSRGERVSFEAPLPAVLEELIGLMRAAAADPRPRPRGVPR